MTFRHRARILAALVMGVNACVSTRVGPATQDRPWPAYLGSAARVSLRLDTLSRDPQPVWRTDVSRGIIGAPALAEDIVVLSSADGQVAMLDRATGDLLWKRRIGGMPSAGPLLADDRIYVATQGYGGSVLALRLTDGKPQWSARTGDIVAPLALDVGAVYAGAVDGSVFRFDTESGRQRWRVRVPGAIRAAPLAVAGGIVVATTADSLFLLDPATGAVKLRRATPGAALAGLALAEGRILMGTTGGSVTALDTATLTPAWNRDLGSGIVGAIAVRAGRAYALTQRGVLWTIPLAEPGLAWSAPIGIIARAGPAPTPDGVYVVSVEGALSRVDSAGRRTWTVQLRAPVVEPVVPDGTMLFAVSQRGEVVAFR